MKKLYSKYVLSTVVFVISVIFFITAGISFFEELLREHRYFSDSFSKEQQREIVLAAGLEWRDYVTVSRAAIYDHGRDSCSLIEIKIPNGNADEYGRFLSENGILAKIRNSEGVLELTDPEFTSESNVFYTGELHWKEYSEKDSFSVWRSVGGNCIMYLDLRGMKEMLLSFILRI